MAAVNFDAILAGAHRAASIAQLDMRENMNALDCGFAWVTLGGNEPLSRWCRKAFYSDPEYAGSRRYYGGKGYPSGWQWWCPGDFGGQSIGIHEAGAKAFRDHLAQFNISATVGSRYD